MTTTICLKANDTRHDKRLRSKTSRGESAAGELPFSFCGSTCYV